MPGGAQHVAGIVIRPNRPSSVNMTRSFSFLVIASSFARSTIWGKNRFELFPLLWIPLGMRWFWCDLPPSMPLEKIVNCGVANTATYLFLVCFLHFTHDKHSSFGCVSKERSQKPLLLFRCHVFIIPTTTTIPKNCSFSSFFVITPEPLHAHRAHCYCRCNVCRWNTVLSEVETLYTLELTLGLSATL